MFRLKNAHSWNHLDFQSLSLICVLEVHQYYGNGYLSMNSTKTSIRSLAKHGHAILALFLALWPSIRISLWNTLTASLTWWTLICLTTKQPWWEKMKSFCISKPLELKIAIIIYRICFSLKANVIALFLFNLSTNSSHLIKFQSFEIVKMYFILIMKCKAWFDFK